MPHVVISCFNSDLDYKKIDNIQNKISKILNEELGCNISAVSIDIKMIKPENWKDEVYNPIILPRINSLIKKPEYKYD
ncbi:MULTISPECIES: hypothetical protein [Xenorhabdus]|uniref:4-oxalocrotonate tautomerase n=1 Tax=Xenorhabdus khoisanae TaxID=880157 RepID=A0A0J5FXM8_9GAMM|nr:hypothetical protein [Xenorhabdus khoisanae]KMJ46948.1 hypothetical protein AB204_00820 [Xenorhabdus khoisanae]